MASQQAYTKPDGPKISDCANQCFDSFQKCLSSAASIHPRELSIVEDQLARFSTWANGIGVFTQGSAAMDHRLRYASDVVGIVTGLLETLNYRCQICLQALGSILEHKEKDIRPTANADFQQSMLDIAAEITRLNKISNTIRRASKHAQTLRAGDFTIKDDEGNDISKSICQHSKPVGLQHDSTAEKDSVQKAPPWYIVNAD
ncbi:serine threonine phosphatase [Fusarium coicis]|nr:serine threonine phosphatase [Fusarium coicis]